MRHFVGKKRIRDPNFQLLEGEAHAGLEAVQRVGSCFKQGASADPAASLFKQNGLRRATCRLDPDKAPTICELVDQSIGRNSESTLDDNNVKRRQSHGRA